MIGLDTYNCVNQSNILTANNKKQLKDTCIGVTHAQSMFGEKTLFHCFQYIDKLQVDNVSCAHLESIEMACWVQHVLGMILSINPSIVSITFVCMSVYMTTVLGYMSAPDKFVLTLKEYYTVMLHFGSENHWGEQTTVQAGIIFGETQTNIILMDYMLALL